MQTLRKVATVLGAVAICSSISGALPTPAHAATKLTVSGLETSEEMMNGHKHQVAKLVINASPAAVQSVLTDYDRTTAMFSNVKRCKVVEDNGAEKKVAFVAAAPGNLWTFDYVLSVKESPNYIEWRRVSGAFKKNEGFWKLEPLDGGRSTKVTYAKFIDGGLLPQAFVVKELRASMPEVMKNLKASAEQHAHVAVDPRTTN